MICIRFPDKDTQEDALGFLAGRFSGRSFANGETIVPEAALEALKREGIPFIVVGQAKYEHFKPGPAAFRDPPAEAV